MSQTTGGRYAANRQDTLPSVTADINRRLKRVESGAGGGSTGDESDPTDGFGNITNLTLSTYTVRDNVKGTDRANIDVNWTPINDAITETMDPSKAKIRDYLVSSTLDGSRYTAERSTTTPPITLTNFPLQQSVTVRVRARSTTGILGPFVSATIQTTKDVTPPNKPSTPTIAAAIRSLKISWDGKDSQGGQQPSDFQRADLHLSNGNNFTPTAANKIHSFGRGGGTHTYSDPREGSFTSWVKLVAYDFSGNASVPSDEASSATQDAIGVNSLIGGGNLLLNSGFDDTGQRDGQGNLNGVYRWVSSHGFNTNLFLNASIQRHGSFCVQMNATGYQFLYQDVVLPPGEYWLTGYVRSSAGATSSGGAGCMVEQVTNGNLNIKSVQRFTSALAEYQRSRVNFTITANCTLRMLVTNSYGGTSTGTWTFDDWQLEEGQVPTAWAPKPNELAFGQVTGFEIADFAIGEADINTGAIVADKIRAGAILADKIAAGEVTTSKLTITNISNLIADPSFELQTLSSGQAGKSWIAQSGWSIVENTGVTRTGKRAAQFTGSTAAITNSVRIPVSPGESYAASAWFNSQNAGGGQGVVRLNCFDKNGNFLRSVSGNAVPPGQGYSRSITVLGGAGGSQGGIPADVSFIEYDLAVFSNSGTWYADDCQLRRLNEGELIVDGSITATKITANILTADKLTIGSVTADNLCQNPSFEDKSNSSTWADKWYTVQGPLADRYSPGLSGNWSARVPSGSWNHSATIPVVPGEVYYVSAQISQPGGGNGQAWFGVGAFTSDPGDGNYRGDVGRQIWAVQAVFPGNPIGGGRYEAQFTCPTDIRFIKMALLDNGSGAFTVFDDVTIRKVSGSTSIKDGAIVTNKIAANQIISNQIQAGQITAAQIDAAGINAERITSGTINGLRFRTGFPGERYIVILDGGDKDAISWRRWDFDPNIGQFREFISTELRGTNNFGNGLYINSSVQIGNTQSSIHQVGKNFSRGPGLSSQVRIRGDHQQCFVEDDQGTVTIPFGGDTGQTFRGQMDISPSFVVATCSEGSIRSDEVCVIQVKNFSERGFQGKLLLLSPDASRNGRPPGQGTFVFVSFYAEATLFQP